MARYMVLGLLLWVVCPPPGVWAADTEVNHCNDLQAREHWDETVAKKPADMELQFLHALWLGLCVKVERQEIAVPQAIELFERARTHLVEQRKAQNEKSRATEAPL